MTELDEKKDSDGTNGEISLLRRTGDGLYGHPFVSDIHWQDWIEKVFGLDLDRGNGFVEWSLLRCWLFRDESREQPRNSEKLLLAFVHGPYPRTLCPVFSRAAERNAA
jgi:hypothetical protein